MKVGIIGLGLIGGSMAIDLKKRGFADEVIGCTRTAVSAAAAEKIGLVDKVVDNETCINEADIIVVSVPADTAARLLPHILDRFGEIEKESGQPCRKIVIDVCSTKEHVIRSVHYHPMRKRYVSTHPMAGTEYSGPWAAMPGLFDGRACIFANTEDSAPDAVQKISKLYDCLNMRVIYMNASNHDVHTAYISHISHVTSFALALTVLDKEKDEKHIFDLASGGFSSTVRLAKSSDAMWVPILTQNRDNVLTCIDTYIEKMKQFRDAIDQCDEEKLHEYIQEANKIKRILR